MREFSNPAERALGRLVAELDYARVDEVITAGLHEFLDLVQTKLNHVGDCLHDLFFALKPVDAGSPSPLFDQ